VKKNVSHVHKSTPRLQISMDELWFKQIFTTGKHNVQTKQNYMEQVRSSYIPETLGHCYLIMFLQAYGIAA
jgi:hypothetical protein